MSELLLTQQSASVTTPASGQASVFADNAVTPTLKMMNPSGAFVSMPRKNASNANQTGFSADTYLAGSSITVPAGLWQAGGIYKLRFDMVKTAAGTATFAINIRMGTAGTTADTAVLTLTFGAGTANADTGIFEVLATFRTVGSGTSAVLQGIARCTHHLAATGLVSTGASGTGIIIGTSAGFASTTQTYIGASINGGASFSGTNTMVISSLEGS
jgi:hypothetical protein